MGGAAAVHQRVGARKRSTEAWVVVDGAGVHRTEGAGETTLAAWGEPFGVTVFASADTKALLFAFTSPQATRFVVAYAAAERTPGRPDGVRSGR